MQPWKPPPWLKRFYLLGSFKEKGKKHCCQPQVASNFTECSTELGCNSAHASTAFWISLGEWLHIRAISQEKCKCCIHLRNIVILSVRGLTLVHLAVQIYIYIWGNPYVSSISINPLRNIYQKHFPFMPFYFLPHRFWGMDFIFRALRKLRTLSWLIMNIHRNRHKKTDFLFHISTTLLVDQGQSEGKRCQNFSNVSISEKFREI